jgi:hypothetical protein
MKTATRTLAAIVSLLVLHPGPADADTLLMKAFIPFDFTVGATTFPSGSYVVHRVGGSQYVFRIRNAHHGVLVAVHPSRTGHGAGAARLEFKRYGDRYFLREIWFSGGEGYPLPETREERELVKVEPSGPIVPVVADDR